jgi:hypothetical protein
MVENTKRPKVLLGILLSIFIFFVNVLGEVPVITSASTNGGQAIINEGMNHLGKPYLWAGKGPNVFDCSGFTSYVYRKVAGIEIGSNTYSQINYPGKEISKSELKPGDLIFTHPGHVGIYIGNNQMIHAPGTGKVVSIANVYKFWRGRRLISESPTIEDLLFDAKFYSDKYPDLKQAFGYNEVQLYNHFITWGIDEGRCASQILDVKYYLANNQDLVQAFGATNYKAAYNHFKVYGMSEGRIASENFNIGIYKSKYIDLVNAFGTDNKAYFNHYLTYGIGEGRIAK